MIVANVCNSLSSVDAEKSTFLDYPVHLIREGKYQTKIKTSSMIIMTYDCFWFVYTHAYASFIHCYSTQRLASSPGSLIFSTHARKEGEPGI